MILWLFYPKNGIIKTMKKEDIITLPNQNLRKKCERVHVITDEVRQIVQDMIDASLDWE
ncbi:MAG: hypothetical protein HXK93_03320, partial [Candidatus Nanogingivalaceae bacterium]|nr:hypothetical protein [Candidatus Nanogingivalaceae bacterium]